MEIKTTFQIPLDDVADLLFSDFESISFPPRISVIGGKVPKNPAFLVHKKYDIFHSPYRSECILNKGGHVVIVDLESAVRPLPRYKINRRIIKKALTLFPHLYPTHFRDFLYGNADKETSRAFTLTILSLFINKK